jgi:hypothetical protein
MTPKELDSAISEIALQVLSVKEHILIGVYLSFNGHVETVQWCMGVMFARGMSCASPEAIRLRIMYHVGDLCGKIAYIESSMLTERKNRKIQDMLECFGNPQ